MSQGPLDRAKQIVDVAAHGKKVHPRSEQVIPKFDHIAGGLAGCDLDYDRSAVQ